MYHRNILVEQADPELFATIDTVRAKVHALTARFPVYR